MLPTAINPGNAKTCFLSRSTEEVCSRIKTHGQCHNSSNSSINWESQMQLTAYSDESKGNHADWSWVWVTVITTADETEQRIRQLVSAESTHHLSYRSC